MQRYIALLIVLLPGLLAVYGIKQMRDIFFNLLNFPYPYLWVQFIAGLLSFVLGLAFVGGFIFYRDRKRNKIQPRFNKK
ncbi:DUF2627 domain-containing protein [Bacillus taeanensis]|uniref:DUF2627 domain-containing protein n=1 Tax=Bacillus taeanensis TaxID=273032 RepID=A0A366Y0S4_9BACI|nr:DUF2627 domain-containing protein [Bacillus taeanensis]RBW70619.1 DUF2627 domain-containing protein [Bacillus taeanensis]